MGSMSSKEVRRVSRQDIQLVQNLIERCLQLYMNQKEVVNTLLTQAKIEPGFTELVWQKLEEENQEFFKAYRVRLMLKNQILLFNQLLEKQVELMRETQSASIAAVSLPNGSNMTSLHQMPYCYSSAPRPDYKEGSVLPTNVLGDSSSHHGLRIADNTSVGGAVADNISSNMLSIQNQNVHMGVLPGINGRPLKVEQTYPNNSEFPFFSDSSFLDERSSIGDAHASSFGSGELNPTDISEPVLDSDTSTFGFLSQIPRNFSFSDLADQFNPDVLESFGKSPFLPSETNNFSALPRRECGGDSKRLDSLTEGVAYK